ncbi:lipoyl(octanoyl) transferase LipB [Pseudobdellovibrio exovorus]|uniref:Octanoyltransferase n=1 Tax=Pseudobdellovibrio exovorus JSS TaxID=1184267 RepID=M4V8J0_9BACT|nr:lipoyl(octanoyl) transferase LipB [Pseudobdellovibrio exovorus]AGH95508.1 hypothetical protein A11Q_1292 [Pseudobdellovibrio exovorus JSS]
MIESKSTSLQIESSYLGCVEYEKSVGIQQDLLAISQNKKSHYIMGLEHPAVLTLGYRAQLAEEVFGASLPVARSTRGGLATVHSEGQLVIYPVLNLRELGIGVRDYVMLLLQTTQELLRRCGIESQLDDKAVGLYTQKGKIAFCGVQIKNGVSQHGLSLNVRNDLSLFSGLRACGVSHPQFDSMAQHGSTQTLQELYVEWVKIFKNQLNQLQ